MLATEKLRCRNEAERQHGSGRLRSHQRKTKLSAMPAMRLPQIAGLPQPRRRCSISAKTASRARGAERRADHVDARVLRLFARRHRRRARALQRHHGQRNVDQRRSTATRRPRPARRRRAVRSPSRFRSRPSRFRSRRRAPRLRRSRRSPRARPASSSAPKMPWKPRAAISNGAVGASAQSSGRCAEAARRRSRTRAARRTGRRASRRRGSASPA